MACAGGGLWRSDSGEPDTDTSQPELLGTYGALLCTASYTAAQCGKRSQTLELIGEAEDAARPVDGLTPEELRRPSVRSLVAGLLHTPGPAPADLRAFAARIHVNT